MLLRIVRLQTCIERLQFRLEEFLQLVHDLLLIRQRLQRLLDGLICLLDFFLALDEFQLQFGIFTCLLIHMSLQGPVQLLLDLEFRSQSCILFLTSTQFGFHLEEEAHQAVVATGRSVSLGLSLCCLRRALYHGKLGFAWISLLAPFIHLFTFFLHLHENTLSGMSMLELILIYD